MYPQTWKSITGIAIISGVSQFRDGPQESSVYRSSSRHVFTNFPNTNLWIFPTKYYVIFIFIFSNAQDWDKNSFQGFSFLFQLRNIGEKIRRFIFGKFVKTCHELNNSYIEARFQDQVARTTVAVGPNPAWNQELALTFKSLNNDYSPETLNRVKVQFIYYVSIFSAQNLIWLPDFSQKFFFFVKTKEFLFWHYILTKFSFGSLKFWVSKEEKWYSKNSWKCCELIK